MQIKYPLSSKYHQDGLRACIATIKIELNHDSVSLADTVPWDCYHCKHNTTRSINQPKSCEYSSIIIIPTFNGTNPAGRIYGWLIFGPLWLFLIVFRYTRSPWILPKTSSSTATIYFATRQLRQTIILYLHITGV